MSTPKDVHDEIEREHTKRDPNFDPRDHEYLGRVCWWLQPTPRQLQERYQYWRSHPDEWKRFNTRSVDEWFAETRTRTAFGDILRMHADGRPVGHLIAPAAVTPWWRGIA